MTREELKAHCLKTVAYCEEIARRRGEEPHRKIYEEHKLILELLEQESFINKPCVSGKVCEHDKNVVLDKIRAETEQTRKMYLDMNDIDWLNGCDYVLSVVDKYRGESEEENGT